ncbi:MAG: dirigent protein [Anaerolineae bacterium]
MKYNRFLLTAFLLALVAIALIAARPQAASTMTLTVVERAETDVVTDTGEEGDTVGDILTFANKIYDEKNENQIGSDNGYCFRTAVGVAWECAWTLTLKDGSLTVQGPFLDAGDSVLAVTGGTGAWADARGSMKLHFRDDKGTEFDFIYELVN